MRRPPPRVAGPSSQRASRTLALASGQFLLIAAAVVVLFWVLGKLWSILLPIVLGLLHRHGAVAGHPVPPQAPAGHRHWPRRPSWWAPSPSSSASSWPSHRRSPTRSPSCRTRPPAALQDVQEWLQGPPFNFGEDQIGSAVDSVINSIQDNAQNIAGYALTGASVVGNSLLNLVLALVLVFFFLKDGPRFVPWLLGPDRAPGRPARGRAVATSPGTRCRSSSASRRWSASSTRSSSASGCGSSGCPLVIPLAVLTFFGGFVPIIGAFVAGAFAVLIALVSNGVTTALLVLAHRPAGAAARGQRPAADHPGPRASTCTPPSSSWRSPPAAAWPASSAPSSACRSPRSSPSSTATSATSWTAGPPSWPPDGTQAGIDGD